MDTSYTVLTRHLTIFYIESDTCFLTTTKVVNDDSSIPAYDLPVMAIAKRGKSDNIFRECL